MLSSDQISNSVIMIHIENFKSYSGTMLSIEIIKQHFVLNSLPRKNSYFFKFYYTIALLLNNIAPGDCKTKRWIYITDIDQLIV